MKGMTIKGLAPTPIKVSEGFPPVYNSCLGALDEKTLSIVIRPDQPEAGKHITLIHEFLHLCDVALIASGISKRRTSHSYITNVAPTLLAVLVNAGLYSGISKAEFNRFYHGMKKPRKSSRRTK